MLKNCHVSFEYEPDCCLHCALFVHNSVNIIIHPTELQQQATGTYLNSHTHAFTWYKKVLSFAGMNVQFETVSTSFFA